MATVKRNYKWGFVDKTGKEVIPFVYDKVGSFSNGFAVVKRDKLALLLIPIGFWGIINKKGRVVLPVKYNEIKKLDHGMIAVNLEGKWGLLDSTIKEIVPPKYDFIRDFDKNLLFVKLNGKFFYIKVFPNGKVVEYYDE